MTKEFTYTTEFGKFAGVGDKIVTEPDEQGRTWTARIEHDDSMEEPWKVHDGHGVISEWRQLDSKGPGERVLVRDRDMARFYDIEETTKIAKRDGWDAEPYKTGTKGEQAARAVETDFRRMQDWCEDRWTWVGVVLSYTVKDHAGNVGTFDYVESCWGIESDAADYFNEVAQELLDEATAK